MFEKLAEGVDLRRWRGRNPKSGTVLVRLTISFPSKCRLFHNATLFGFCITHILNTGCAKI
jgi:hypothetical protein